MGTLDPASAVALTQQMDPTRDSHIMVEDRAPFLEILAQLPQAQGFGPYRSDPCSLALSLSGQQPEWTLLTMNKFPVQEKDEEAFHETVDKGT